MSDENPTTSEAPVTPSTDNTTSSYIVLKSWNFDGLIIQSIRKPGKIQKKEEEASTDGEIEVESTVDDGDENDDASTVLLDDSETVEDRLNSLVNSNLQELETEAVNEAFEKVEEAIVEDDYPQDEYQLAADTEENYDGAAGLWGKDYQLQCFKAPAVHMPTFQTVGYVQTSAPELDIYDLVSGLLRPEATGTQPKITGTRPKTKQTTAELAAAYDETLVFTKAVDDCSFCKRQIEVGRGVVLKDCLHSFCRPCLINGIKNNEHAVMKCPSATVNCAQEVRDEEIKALLTPEAYDKYTLEMLYKMNVVEVAELVNEYEYVENKHDFQCGICLQDILSGDGVVLKGCLHHYCKPCLERYITGSNVALVPCPFRDDDGLHCVGFLMDSEVRSLVPEQVYLDFIRRSLKAAEAECPNAFHCKTPDCPAWVEIVGEIDQYTCPTCNKVNCVKCKAVHQGTSCDGYQEMVNGPGRRAQENVATENQVRGMIVSKTAQNCPRCGIVIQRVEGCREMQCAACKTPFNWTGI